MKKVYIFLLINLVGYNVYSFQREKENRQDVDFGVVLNQDGDLSFVNSDPVLSEKLLRANVNFVSALGVKTLVYSVASGSDVLYYPTKVSSEFGWRKTKYEDENPTWRARMKSARNALAAGMDAIQIVGSQAKSNKMLFLPSLRMNDSHFMSDPFNYPLTGKFWLENTDLIIKDSPISFSKQYGNLLDFGHEKVRDYRLRVVKEVIERNKEHIDGFELDFNRVQVFFPKGKADVGAPLMTDFVRKVRKELNDLAKQQGRPMYLFVRIPPSEESCKWAGLDIDTWMKEGLVDLISPAQLMTLAHEMPIEGMIAKAHQNGVKVYPSLYGRTSWRVPFAPSETTLGFRANGTRNASNQETLAAASNYKHMGADGFYLYNYYVGTQPVTMYPLVAALKDHNYNSFDKVFAITKTYYNDDKVPSYAYVKQLPFKTTSEKVSFNIYVGESAGKSPYPLVKCLLRLGINGGGVGVIPKVFLNGNAIEYVQQEDHTKYSRTKIPTDAAQNSLIYKIDDLSFLRQGNNKVEVIAERTTITDLEIGYAYFNNMSLLIRGVDVPELNKPARTIKKTQDENFEQ